MTWLALTLSGAIAGLGGATIVTGELHRFNTQLSPGYGFTAIAVALVGDLQPLWICVAAFGFGILESGGLAMQASAQVPKDAIHVIEGLIIFVLAARRYVATRVEGTLPVSELIATLVVLTLIKATPIIYAALGGVISERSGVINIGLEGMMAAGAFFAVVVSFATHSPVSGLLAGIVAGGLFGCLLAVAATRFKVDQIVAGTGINLICAGGAAYGLVRASSTNPAQAYRFASLGQGFWILIVLAFVLAVRIAVGALSHALGTTDPGVR